MAMSWGELPGKTVVRSGHFFHSWTASMFQCLMAGPCVLTSVSNHFAIPAVFGARFDLSQCLANFVRHWCFRALSMWVLF